MTNASADFGRLLKAAISSIMHCENKKATAIEKELGKQIGVSSKSIQRYKSGYIPPEDRMIEILAEAAVRRGYLDREWLQRFLYAARYPFASLLLDQLCPPMLNHSRPPRVYHNLPPPTYQQFVMRELAFAEVLDGLQQRSAVVLLVGLGGAGKTSLAREVAHYCLHTSGDISRFDAVVWVSDKDRPGSTNLSIVLDEIARTLDYPGVTQFEYEEECREVWQLLRRRRVLVVIDNFETITDSALLSWLLRLPEPSKALITSREYSRAFRNSTSVVELCGMNEIEAWKFIDQRLRALRLTQVPSNHTQLESLLAATNGNPKAIEMVLGLIKHEHRPLQQIRDDLYAGRGELFADLFARAWILLDEAARRVLLVLTFFPTSACGEALAVTSGVQGYVFDCAVERLADLALLDVQQESLNTPPYYALHPLVRIFAEARLAELSDLEQKARERWIGWYIQLVAKAGCCWNDLSKLDLLDAEQDAICAAFEWVCSQHRNRDTIRMARDLQYYYYVRGYWNKKQNIEWRRFEAAHTIADTGEEVLALSFYIQTLSRRSETDQLEQHVSHLKKLVQSVPLSEEMLFHVQHAQGLYWLARGDNAQAQIAWETSLAGMTRLNSFNAVVNRKWIAVCYFNQGYLDEAERLFTEIKTDATRINYQQGVLSSQCRLAAIYLARADIQSATEHLKASFDKATEFQDRQSLAQIHRLGCRLYTFQGNLAAARMALAEAIDLFERLGMRRELAEARAALVDLETREAIEMAG